MIRRSLRVCVTVFSGLSFLLLLVVCAAWVRSYRYFDLVGYESAISPDRPQWGGNGSSATGLIIADVWRRTGPRSRPPTPAASMYQAGPLPPSLAAGRAAYVQTITQFRLLGFAIDRETSDPAPARSLNRGSARPAASVQTVWRVAVPYWQPAALLVPAPAVWAWRAAKRRRARRRQARNCCPACGYDCRATPQRCPECGLGLAA